MPGKVLGKTLSLPVRAANVGVRGAERVIHQATGGGPRGEGLDRMASSALGKLAKAIEEETQGAIDDD